MLIVCCKVWCTDPICTYSATSHSVVIFESDQIQDQKKLISYAQKRKEKLVLFDRNARAR